MKAEWTFPKRYDFKLGHGDWQDAYVKPLESEFGQYVSYSAYENLLKAIDSLEERGLGYWQGDEFVVYESDCIIRQDKIEANRCGVCNGGNLKELSIYDDWEGMLTCEMCGTRIKK